MDINIADKFDSARQDIEIRFEEQRKKKTNIAI